MRCQSQRFSPERGVWWLCDAGGAVQSNHCFCLSPEFEGQDNSGWEDSSQWDTCQGGWYLMEQLLFYRPKVVWGREGKDHWREGAEEFLPVLPKALLKLQCFLLQAEALKIWWLWTWPGINPQESMSQSEEWTWRPAPMKWSHSCR